MKLKNKINLMKIIKKAIIDCNFALLISKTQLNYIV
jgi:hypothetical protein